MRRWLISGAILLAAALSVLVTYWDYVVNPWTRDGQVRAQVIRITPRVSAPIMNLPIVDNQLVKKGDALFELDPRTFQAALLQAKADLAVANVKVANAKTKERRYREASKMGSGAVSKIELELKWIRLAQRVPVRIQLLHVPDGIALRVGTTASVLVLTGTADQDGDDPVAAAPRPLQ